MKHERLVKELKNLGLMIEKAKWHDDHYFCKNETNNVSWYKQDDQATCVHLMSNKHLGDDKHSDCFFGYFADTYKSVKNYMSGERK